MDSHYIQRALGRLSAYDSLPRLFPSSLPDLFFPSDVFLDAGRFVAPFAFFDAVAVRGVADFLSDGACDGAGAFAARGDATDG